jgi:pimeloyl-ACP methyl ester carboxylesterase
VTSSKRRIVLVHGLAASERWWRPVLPALRDYDVVYGDPRRTFEVGDDAILVGHSLGGLRAAQYAAQHPVRKLVLVDPAGIPWGRRFVLDTLAMFNQAPLRFMPTIAADSLRWGPRALIRYGLEATRTRVDVSTITAPTLIVWGDRDNLVPVRVAPQWHEAIPGSRLEIIPRARHVPMVENTSSFVEVLLDFLRDDVRSGVVDGVRLAGNDDEPTAR